jgi:hypothetical protein
MNTNKTTNDLHINYSNNPFFCDKSKTQKEEDNKNQNFDMFINNNPFSQQNLNPNPFFKMINLNQNNTHLSGKSKDNSNYYTPASISNPKNDKNDVNMFNFNNTNNVNNIQSNIFPNNKNYNKNDNINSIESLKKNDNDSFNISGNAKYFSDISFLSKNESNKTAVLDIKKSNDKDFNKNEILPLYDNQTNELIINNLNTIIENSNNSEPKAIMSNSINSSLDIIKEEQNESDKKSEKDIKKISLNNNKINIFKSNNNNYDKELISIGKINDESINEEELQNILNENNDNINSILLEYNNKIINDIIDIDINVFKNKINEFVTYSKNIIEKLKILDDICDKIKSKIIISYEIQQKIQENKINEYQKMKEYENKLDYVISIQNKFIEELEDMNAQIIKNINESPIKKEVLINENDIVKNCDNVEINLKNLYDLINNNFCCDNDLNGIEDNLFNDLDNIKENITFFEIINNIYNEIKNINSIYQKLSLKNANIGNNNV